MLEAGSFQNSAEAIVPTWFYGEGFVEEQDL